MTPQCEVGARGGDKTDRWVTRGSSAFSRRPGSAFRNSIPAGQVHNEFTGEDHLLVQRKIEERAHLIWIANVLVPHSMLDDWLKAEDEVLLEFVEKRMLDQPRPPASSGKTPPRTGEYPSGGRKAARPAFQTG